jgi:hypothetical protein
MKVGDKIRVAGGPFAIINYPFDTYGIITAVRAPHDSFPVRARVEGPDGTKEVWFRFSELEVIH